MDHHTRETSQDTLGYGISDPPKVGSFKRRVHGWTWQAYPIGMGTGAVYVTLSGLKEHNKVFTGVEAMFYILNICLFLLNTSTLLIQAILYPKQSWRLIQSPTKGIFVPLVVLSFATIIIGTINYTTKVKITGPTLAYVLFWIYVAFAVVLSMPMMAIWFNKPHDLSEFTPAYAFLLFPMMLVGVVAFNTLNVLDPSQDRAMGVLLTGYFFQGLGFFMTFFYLCIYVIRVMQTGFLEGHQANGAFVACGPPGFTALALINLAEKARAIFKHHDYISPNAGEMWYWVSVMSALMLYGLAVFLFFFGLMPFWNKVHKHLHEILGFWALTFPNVGWISTTRLLGDIFNVRFLYVFHMIMAAAMCVTWLVLIVLTVIAFWRGKIFYSSEDAVLEDSKVVAAETEPQQQPEMQQQRASSSMTTLHV